MTNTAKTTINLTDSVVRRWSSRVRVPADIEQCWEWIGGKFSAGYGVITVDGRKRGAHQVSFAIHNRDFQGLPRQIRHTCDNRPCVNPLHLVEGSAQDNSSDMVRRRRSLTGETSPAAKLTLENVVSIREQYARGEGSYRALAAQYGVSFAMIKNIVKNRNWNEQKEQE